MPPRCKPSAVPRFQCPHCLKQCYSTSGLTQHLNLKHFRDERLQPPPSRAISVGLPGSLEDEDIDNNTQGHDREDASSDDNDRSDAAFVLKHSLLNGKSSSLSKGHKYTKYITRPTLS